MQEDGYWLYWTNPQPCCSDGCSSGTDCCLQHGFCALLAFSSAGLMLLPSILLRSRSLVQQLAQQMNHVPGACIKLYKVYKRLPNCLGSYLTPEMRAGVFSFPSPATGLPWICHLAVPPVFSTGVTLARDLHQNLYLMDEIFNPQPKNQIQATAQTCLSLMKARFSQRTELFLWSKPALMRGQLQLNRSSSLLCQQTFHVFCFCSTAHVAHKAEAVS